MTNDDNENDTFAKTICSICYEDLRPIAEDLQSISLCGHVFHELCLQQWFEYCSSTKKCTCPVCKQTCKAKDASRLYFQSTSDPSSLSLRPPLDPDSSRIEIARLERKVSALESALARHEKDASELKSELCLCKETVKTETALKDEAVKEKASLQLLLRRKIDELNKTTAECSQLQGRTMALAKELASIKLVSDLDLDEEEVHKLASFGNVDNNQDTIEILRRSLVMRNRSYKELMAKCNSLGRGESRSTQKLAKAKEKISRLKDRVKELEMAAEVKENRVLRDLKASKKTHINTNPLNVKPNFVAQNKLPNVDPSGGLRDDLSSSRNLKYFNLDTDNLINHTQDGRSTVAHNDVKDSSFSICVDLPKSLIDTCGVTHSDSNLEITEDGVVKCTLNIPNATCDTKKETSLFQNTKTYGDDISDDVVVLLDDPAQVKPVVNIRKAPSTLQPLSNLAAGASCFSGGLPGPDGTNRYLGKWCKRSQGTNSNGGDLISVGADGRGGRIKVLRSLNQSSPSSLDSEPSSAVTKRLKLGGKTNSQPSRGCLQIEHFFGKGK